MSEKPCLQGFRRFFGTKPIIVYNTDRFWVILVHKKAPYEGAFLLRSRVI